MNRILIGHVLDCLAEIPDESVHGIVTSPPYWSLRDYKTEPQIWGGDNGCRHEWGNENIISTGRNDQDRDTRHTDGRNPATQGLVGCPKQEASTGQFCLHCGAWRGSLGLEPQPEMYIEHIVEICRELRRVLRSDGVFWLNIGDSYSGSGKGIGSNHGKAVFTDGDIIKTDWEATGLKPKDLCLIPFRLALALQADGWWVRSACIWYKRNCMPESASDRPTVDYEYVFLLTKAARYFYDGDAVREPNTEGTIARFENGAPRKRTDKRENTPYDWQKDDLLETPLAGRNLRTVWDIPTVSYSEAHFATFPPELAARCIKVTPMDVCAECGAGYERLTEKGDFVKTGGSQNTNKINDEYDKGAALSESGLTPGYNLINTIGFIPTCTCNADKAKAVILDPFAGSGTVGQAANDLGREFILIELNPDYYKFMEKRLGMFCPEPEYIGDPVGVS